MAHQRHEAFSVVRFNGYSNYDCIAPEKIICKATGSV